MCSVCATWVLNHRRQNPLSLFRSHSGHTGRQATSTHLELILLGPCILGPSEGPPTATETTGQANQPQPIHCLQCEKAMARMLLSRWTKRGPCTVASHNEISLLPLRSRHAPSGAKSALVTPPCGRQNRNVWQSVLHRYAWPQEIVTTWTPSGAKAAQSTTPSLRKVHDAESNPRLHTLTIFCETVSTRQPSGENDPDVISSVGSLNRQ